MDAFKIRECGVYCLTPQDNARLNPESLKQGKSTSPEHLSSNTNNVAQRTRPNGSLDHASNTAFLFPRHIIARVMLAFELAPRCLRSSSSLSPLLEVLL